MSKFPYTVCFYCADQNRHRDRSRGITHYTYELLSHLCDENAVKLKAFVSKSSFAVPEGVEQVTWPFPRDRLHWRLFADHVHPFVARRDVADIWHYPKGFLPAGFQVRGKKVGTVADVMMQFDADHHPESRPRLAWAYWLRTLKHSIQNLDLILTISEFSKQGIIEFCDRHRLKHPPIIVTSLGVEISQVDKSRPKKKEDYVVHLASRLPHKATTWLLDQWILLGQTTKDLPMLRLVGDLDARGAALLSKIAKVSLTTPLPRTKLEEMIAGARALLLPSWIEGFGIPAIESYLLGTPVAYVKGTAVEEILENDPIGGFHRDFDSFRTALTQVLNLDSTTIERKGMMLAQRYTWENCVRRTLEAYRTVL
jgi:glycosyltransferase involved in cell wall biosynthesis